MKIETLNAIYLIGMISTIALFIYYFLSVQKSKGFPIDKPLKVLEKIRNREYIINGYHFSAPNRNEAVKKLKRFCARKGLMVLYDGRETVIVLNERNKIRKSKGRILTEYLAT